MPHHCAPNGGEWLPDSVRHRHRSGPSPKPSGSKQLRLHTSPEPERRQPCFANKKNLLVMAGQASTAVDQTAFEESALCRLVLRENSEAALRARPRRIVRLDSKAIW